MAKAWEVVRNGQKIITSEFKNGDARICPYTRTPLVFRNGQWVGM